MEKRAEPRLSIRGAAMLTVLSGAGETCPAEMVNLSGRGMQILVGGPLPAGAPVRLDATDCMWLGEVCYCQPVQDGYVVGLRLDQFLSNLSSLERLTRRLLGDRQEAPRVVA